jgi:hypothetical protein
MVVAINDSKSCLEDSDYEMVRGHEYVTPEFYWSQTGIAVGILFLTWGRQ